MKRNSLLILMLFFSVSVLFARQVKLLTIGNSFSVDGVENYLYDLAKANGDTIIIGNMHIGGCSLERHYKNSVTNSTDYEYHKIVDGVNTNTRGFTLIKALEDEHWDYISFQQASPLSGKYDSYFPYIDSLIVFARKHSANPDFELVLHMTWAYAQDSKHTGFAAYNNDQLTMYHDIVNAVTRVADKIQADIVVPAGTAIQNGRTSSLGDTFNRDGFHLELTYGRYTAACTWFEKLFGISAIGSSYRPSTVTPQQAKIAQYAAHYAVKYPRSITMLNGF